MLDLDGAESQREPDQVGEAELRAGEIVPAGLGVLGGDAIGGDVDALHLVGRDALVVEQADQRLDRGLDVAAARIGLDVAVGDAERHGRRQHDSARLVGAAEGESLHEAVARLDHIGRAFDPLLRQQRGLQAFARGVAGVQALDVGAAVDEREQSGRARGGDAECVGKLPGREPAQLAGRHDRAEHADRGRRMESALAQVGMARAPDRDLGFIAGDHGLDQRRAGDPPVVAEREHRRHHHAARMHRALAEAVIELDAVRRGAAEEGGIDQVGPPRAAGHRDAAGRPHRRQHGLGAGRDLAARTGDHDAHGVEQMPPRVMAHLVGERGMTELVDELDDGLGRADGGMKRLQGFGVGHACLRMAR